VPTRLVFNHIQFNEKASRLMQPTETISLRTLLQVTLIGEDLFQGVQPHPDAQRVFGGQLLGQSLVAAGNCVPAGILPNSTHARFLRAPNAIDPINYRVTRLRDGSSYFNREVVAEQEGQTVMTMSVSFHRNESGLEHTIAISMVEIPDPEDLPPFIERMQPYTERLNPWFRRPRPVDVRYVGDPPWEAADKGEIPDHSRVWMRAEPIDSDDPLIHAAAKIYASDMTILDSAIIRHGLGWDPTRVRAATLDHGMWFHEHVRADNWFLYDQQCPWTGNGRALAAGSMYTQEGRRLATIVQEAVLRTPR
jgi:acyl-CoA thioesterase-2